MDFDVTMFQISRPGDPCWEADLLAILDHYQGALFPDVLAPIRSITFASLESPGLVLIAMAEIEIDERLRNFTKLCCFVVLHELINNKFFWKYGKVPDYSSPEFKALVGDMLTRGAYDGLL